MEMNWENLVAFFKQTEEYAAQDYPDHLCIDGHFYRKDLEKFLTNQGGGDGNGK